ncbi:MAG: ABC transporter ATP-binding protein [Alphaproteobacteria bacterium]|nr:ABC transporter ATP-binding protein [Alphaproteobacteria bacterium]
MNPFTKTFLFFFKFYRFSTIAVIFLLILAGLAEAIGIAAFLPFFQIILEGKDNIEHIPEGRIRDFLSATGITLNFTTVALFIVTAITVKAAILWLAMRRVSHTVAMISADLRWRLMKALLCANWRFFTDHTLGASLNAVVMETFRSSMTFVSLTRFFSHVIQFLVYATGAFLLSWQVFLGGICTGTFLVFSLWGLVRIARKAGVQQTNIAKTMLSRMADMLQGIKPLRAMALEGKFFDLLSKDSKGLEKAQFDQLSSAQAMRIFHEPLMVIAALAGLFLAITYADLTSSELALMTVLFIRLLTGMNNAQGEYQRLMSQESALCSLMDSIEKTEKAADNWPGHGKIPSKIEKITIQNACFSHGDKTILSNVRLTFDVRQMTALIGTSGSGKTTILDLLSGFYMPDTGAILINNQPLDQLDLNRWRHAIGFVPQEVFLFNDSILENILMSRSELSEKDAWKALAAAGGREFVEALPQGLHAPVGENGRLLSGGQRQRIAIARAIIHKPQILLLDEATSALDPETEKILLKTLKRLARNMAVIFISHNTTVLDYADKVYKIKDGQVEEQTS